MTPRAPATNLHTGSKVEDQGSGHQMLPMEDKILMINQDQDLATAQPQFLFLLFIGNLRGQDIKEAPNKPDGPTTALQPRSQASSPFPLSVLLIQKHRIQRGQKWATCLGAQRPWSGTEAKTPPRSLSSHLLFPLFNASVSSFHSVTQ